MDPITITLTLLALKTVLGGKTAVSATPEVANAQQQLADATALNTRIQQENVVLKQQAEQANREMDSANDTRTKAEAANRAIEAQKQRDEGLRVQAASAQDVADLKQQLAVAVGVAQTARDERDKAQATLQKQLADATALNTRIQQEVVTQKQQAEQANRDYENANDIRIKNEAAKRAIEAQKQREDGLQVQAKSAKVVAGLQQQLVVAEQRSGEERRNLKEAEFAQERIREEAEARQYQKFMIAKAEASKTAPVAITKSVTSRDLNRN